MLAGFLSYLLKRDLYESCVLPLGSKRRKLHSLVSLVYRRNNDILGAQLRGKGAKMKIQTLHPFYFL
jgi:hypothetical protein